MNTPALLAIEGLQVRFDTPGGPVRAVEQVDLALQPGEVLGLVGESGCGKTVSALSILRLIEPPGRITGGSVLFEGRDLLKASTAEMLKVRGAGISMIFQQPRSSLNPVIRIGRQIAEQLVRKAGMDASAAEREAVALLSAVRLPAPERKAKAYPHELSGGQAQRVMIAIALALKPRVLIADEPTTSLDVTVQAEVLALLAERCRSLGTAMILVTHDLGVVAQVADRVAVMYAGRIVEQADVQALFDAPRHPYTRGLLGAVPTLGARVPRLIEIPGQVPAPVGALRPGCAFAPRCPLRVAQCDAGMPDLAVVTPGHRARCWLAR
jgi:oligopeptide/dipeptide ABC transporter ATP-binding protein